LAAEAAEVAKAEAAEVKVAAKAADKAEVKVAAKAADTAVAEGKNEVGDRR
jgi:hypothetical protein